MTLSATTSTPISLGYKLRFLIMAELDAQGLTRAELADRTGFTEKHVSQLLNARCGMSVEVADRLMRALNREWAVGTAPAFGEPVTENWQITEQGKSATGSSPSPEGGTQ